MFTLVTDRSKFFRVKRGQTAAEIQKTFSAPVVGAVFSGRILEIDERAFSVYCVAPGETYRSIAVKLKIEEEELKRVNSSKPVYPSCKLFVPCN